MGKKEISLAVIIALLAIFGLIILLKGRPQDEEPVALKSEESKVIKIGAILQLTGDMAIFGESFKKGIDMAVEVINTAGGIQGKKVKIIYEDDAAKAKLAVSAFRKLITQDKVQAVIAGGMSSTAMSIAPIAEENKVVIISPTASAPALSEFKNYFFRIQASDNYEGRVMAEFAYKKLDTKEVGIFYVNNDWGQGLAEVFKDRFTALGGEVTIRESHELGATDFKTQITKIKTVNPENLYLIGYLQEMSIILRQMRELGLKPRILSAYGFHDPKLLEMAGDIAENAIFTMPTYDPESDDPTIVKFVERYKAKYGKEPDMFAAHTYDCMKILAYAMRDGATTGPEISACLHKVANFPGVTGENTFDENGDVVKPLRIFTVKEGKFTPFSRWEPGETPR